jgi:hypothetical protein
MADRQTSSLDIYKDGEKGDIDHVEDARSGPDLPTPVAGPSGARDAALEILGEQNALIDISPDEDASVLHKIDWWLMPVNMVTLILMKSRH